MINVDGGGPRHWAIVEYDRQTGEPVASLCECELGYHHEPDGSPDLTAPAGEIPHQPDPVEIVPFTTDGTQQPAQARCLTCKGLLQWRPQQGWGHVDAPHLDPKEQAVVQ